MVIIFPTVNNNKFLFRIVNSEEWVDWTEAAAQCGWNREWNRHVKLSEWMMNEWILKKAVHIGELTGQPTNITYLILSTKHIFYFVTVK